MTYKLNPITGKLDFYLKSHLKLSDIGTRTHAQIDTKLDGIEDGATADQTKADIDGLGLSHGSLVDVEVDDHTQYVLVDSTRDIIKDQNDITNLVVDNGTNGTAAKAAFRAQSDGGSVSLSALSAGHLTSSQYKTDSALLEADASLIGGLHLSAAGASEVGFWTNGTRRGSIWLDGKWKIGVGIPTEVLDVDGNIAVSGTVDGVDIAALDIAVDGLTDNSIADTLHRHSELVASDGSPDPVLSCDTAGNVGIGIAAPSALLHVEGTDYPIIKFVRDAGISNTGDWSVQDLTVKTSQTPQVDFGPVQLFNINSTNIGRIKFSQGSTAGQYGKFFLELANGGNPNTNIVLMVLSNGNVGIGTTIPATSAKLDLTSTTGALLLTRMTTTQKNALTAVNGMVLYDSTLNKFQGYENGSWTSLI